MKNSWIHNLQNKSWWDNALRNIMQFKNDSIAYIRLLWDKIKTRPNYLYYLAAVIIGLGLARLVDVSILTYISRNQDSKVSVKTASFARTPSLTSSKNVDPTQVVGGALFAEAPIEEKEEMEVPQINYTVLGTIAGHPSFASAVLKPIGNTGGIKMTTREYGTGQTIGADRLIYIGREYILVKRGEQKIKINVGQNAFEATQSAINRSSGIEKTISRQDANRILKGNPAAIYKGASFGPVLEGGNITGYKIHRVKPSHFFYKLGARPGDIVRKVNGFELKDTERMFELWKSMKTATNVDLDLERGGKVLKYKFKIAK